jgi:hypothetical protein
MKRLAVTLVMVLITAGTSARAQDLPTTETTHLDLTPYLHPGTPIRISGHSLRRVGGYVVGVQDNTILVGNEKGVAADGAKSIKLATVDTLWTRGNWFWPGVALGGSAGALVGGAACVFGGEDECKVFPVAIATGLAIGAAVGTARKIWKQRFVRRDGGPVPTIGPWNQR